MQPRLGGHATPSLGERRSWIARFRHLVAARTDDLLDLLECEIGKPRHEAIASEILPLLSACRWHERTLRRILGPTRLRGGPIWMPGQRIELRREPLGRVAIIATWNYPIQLLGIQLVQAVAGGNEVVVKPSEHAPRCQGLLLELAREAGLSSRGLSWTEATRAAGEALLLGERFDHIVFTGSSEVGRAIAELAAQSMTPTTIEGSGRDSAFVLEDADCELAARTLWHAVTLNAGQTCTAPRRILVEEGAYGRFLSALAPRAAAARPRRLISSESAERTWLLARRAVESGGRSLSGLLEGPIGPRFRPLAIVDCPPDAALVEGGHFGPAVAVVRVEGLIDALQIHRRVDQHLATSVFTRRPARLERMLPMFGAATVTVNDCILPTAHPATAIGGRGASGWGMSRGVEGLRAMTRAVHCSRTRRWLRAPVDEPDRRGERLLRRLVDLLYGRWGGARRPSAGGRIPLIRSVSGDRALDAGEDARASETGPRTT